MPTKTRTPDTALEHFLREYDANGGNGARAYLAAHPGCSSRRAAAVEASRILTRPNIQARLRELAEAKWKRVAMNGDEAAALVAGDARADIRELYDDRGNLLPIQAWPDSIARSVKAIRPGKDGTTVVLNDSLAARRIILEQTGRLKQPAGVGDLARLLAGGDDAEADGD